MTPAQGMDPDIRPQDDLFGHVNGRWLDETEIPSDRSSWGPFVQLADVAEEQVRAIIEELAPRRPTGEEPRRGRPARSPTFTPRSWTPSGSTERGLRPLQPLLDGGRGAARRPRPRGVPRRVRAARRLRALRLLRRHRRPRTPTATCSTSSRAGSGCRTSPTTARTSSPRSARSTSPTSTGLLDLAGQDDPAGAAATDPRRSTPGSRPGHWERAETRDVQKTYNLTTLDELKQLCPAFDWDAYVPNLGGHARRPTSPRSCVRQPSYLEHLSHGARRDADRGLADLAAQPGAALRGAVPHRRLRRDQLRLLRPHPHRHARAARPLEARRRARRGRDRRGRRQGVRRPALPAGVQGADGRPGRQPAGGLPPVDHRTSTG